MLLCLVRACYRVCQPILLRHLHLIPYNYTYPQQLSPSERAHRPGEIINDDQVRLCPPFYHSKPVDALVKMASSANPITSAVPSNNPISSVSQSYAPPPLHASNQQLLSRLNLDLRGRIFPVDREMLMLLPESVLLGLFPQGLILSKPASWDGADDGVFTVDVSYC